MYKKVHFRLSMLFTAVSTLILTVMSGIYLYMNYTSLTESALLGFRSDINTFAANFERNTTISYDLLKSLQTNYEYEFFVYDNGVPFRFTHDTKNKEQWEFADRLYEYSQRNIEIQQDPYTAGHEEFTYKEKSVSCHVSLIVMPTEKGSCEIYVVHSLKGIYAQFRSLIMRFLQIIIVTAVILYLFSRFYTKKLLAPIRKSQEKQSRFIAAASHEIRNPVNTILSALDAMEKCDDMQRSEFSDIAKKEGHRLARLTSDLLTLARSDDHAFNANLGSAELDTLLIDCYEAFTAAAAQKKILFTIELPEGAVNAENIDGERIRQVISILLDNAISYTEAGGLIILKYSETSKAHIIEVIDNGIGISDEDKPHIFDRFYRADKARESKSHFGLGLCIAKELVELHYGTLTVKDTKGGGTTFSVSLKK